MQDFSKSQKRHIRELAGLSYERELKKSLSALAAKFEEWKAGTVSSIELNQLLHEYDYGESRKLWAMYENVQQDILVARAIANGLISEQEAGEEIFLLLSRQIEFYKKELSETN